jgi:hypothetical protein
MLRRTAVSLLAALVVVVAAAPSTPAQAIVPAAVGTAATTCTGWRSQITPPPTIRVLRTYGPAAGTVQIVSLRPYVENVMAWEWPSTYPSETLKAGAVAIKQYAWYYAIHYRGKTARNGACYDVVDSTADQLYRPETRSAATAHRSAVAAGWRYAMHKSGALFLSGYAPGADVGCGTDSTGYRLYQHSARRCGLAGLAMEGILREYYYPNLDVFTPSDHHMTGDTRGDGGALAVSADILQPIVYTTSTGSFAPVKGPTSALESSRRLGFAAGDLTGDGRHDLVYLVRDGTKAQHVVVLRGASTGFTGGAIWWSSAVEGPGLPNEQGGVRSINLLVADFTADGLADVGLLVGQPDYGRSRLYLLRSTGSDFATMREHTDPTSPIPIGVRNGRAFAGDVTGDGRSDLVIEIDKGTGGLAYAVMRSTVFSGRLTGPVTWHTATDLRRSTSRLTVADVERDGRDDLVVAHSVGGATRLTALVSTGTAFVRDLLWTTSGAAAEPADWSRVKIGPAELNGDGRGDVVLYYHLGTGASRVYAVLSSGGSMRPQNWLNSTALDWLTAIPY